MISRCGPRSLSPIAAVVLMFAASGCTASKAEKLTGVILSGNPREVQKALDDRAPLRGYNTQGQSMLYVAVWGDKPEALRLLLDAGLPVNYPNEVTGFTALHLAARVGRDDIVRYLLARGAQVDARGVT